MKSKPYYLLGSILLLLSVQACGPTGRTAEEPTPQPVYRLKQLVGADITEAYSYTEEGRLERISLIDNRTGRTLSSGGYTYRYEPSGRLSGYAHPLQSELPRLFEERATFQYPNGDPSCILIEKQVALNRPDNFVTALRDSLICTKDLLTALYQKDYSFSSGYQDKAVSGRESRYSYDADGQLTKVETKVYDLSVSPTAPVFVKRTVVSYEHDGKPNPTYSPARPASLQHSVFLSPFRYNVTKASFQTGYTEEGPIAEAPIVTEYTYTYRADGLPEKRTDALNGEIRFEYEEVK